MTNMLNNKLTTHKTCHEIFLTVVPTLFPIVIHFVILIVFFVHRSLFSLQLQELKANPQRNAKGTVIEAGLHKSKGPIATFIVQNGTLKQGDTVVCGEAFGKVGNQSFALKLLES